MFRRKRVACTCVTYDPLPSRSFRLEMLSLCAVSRRLPRAWCNAFSASNMSRSRSFSALTPAANQSRGYSTAGVINLLNSRVSFRLANAVYVGVIGTLIIYAFRRKSKKQKKNEHCETEISTVPCRFKDKTVVITGGAGDIGMNTALAFAREKATVFLIDLPQVEKGLAEKCKALEQEGAHSAQYVTCDMTREDSVKEMVRSITGKAGRIDIFFNNAGIQGRLAPIQQQDGQEFSKVLAVNIYGVFLGMKYVSLAMMESGAGGVIVNTASVAGLLGPANMAAYAASKFAVIGMTKTAAKDLARHGIRVCAIAPAILEGRMWGTQVRGNAKCRKELAGDTTEVTEEEVRVQELRMIEGTPMKRLGKMSEVASVVTFLCSEDASYLTGLTVPIDGGRIQ